MAAQKPARPGEALGGRVRIPQSLAWKDEWREEDMGMVEAGGSSIQARRASEK